MNIGIIGAMNEELKPIRQLAHNLEQIQKGRRVYWHGTIHRHEIYLTRCDPGKVNAVIATQQMIDDFKVHVIFNMGSSGALSPDLEVGDLVVATEAIQHDVDLTSWGMKPGELMFDVVTADNGQLTFNAKQAFETNTKLSKIVLETASSIELKSLNGYVPKVHTGRILSGDQFINNREKAENLWNTLKGLCTDMEAAAIAQTCFINEIPFLCIRAISDKADHSATISFTDFLVAATANYGHIFDLAIKRFDEI